MIFDDDKDILRNFGNLIVQRLKEKLSEKKINASGDLSASIRYEADHKGLRIYAADYIYYVNYGRKPGKRPPIAAIKTWIEEKHIFFEGTLNSLAFAIATSIEKKGTRAWQQGGTNVIEEVITDDLIQEIEQAFTEGLIKEITSEILDIYGLNRAA